MLESPPALAKLVLEVYLPAGSRRTSTPCGLQVENPSTWGEVCLDQLADILKSGGTEWDANRGPEAHSGFHPMTSFSFDPAS